MITGLATAYVAILQVFMLNNALPVTEATTAFTILILILIVLVTISALASMSRQMFAFA
jgi:hypothetical protein